jgi:hypothetical protein
MGTFGLHSGRVKTAILILLIFLAISSLEAQTQTMPGFENRRTMDALRLNPDESITVDGRLDESVWNRAVPAADFIQIDPENGAPATEKTEVRILFNEDRMYMGVICYDSQPEEMRGNTMQRDAFLSADDRFMWIFDTYLDQRTGYFFEINPSGAMGDNLLGGSGNNARAWDGIWIARVRRSEIGWVAEIEMPFRTLNFDPNGKAWGINFQRTVRRKNEESIWNGHTRNQSLQTMSNAGLVVGISDVNQGVGLDVRPFVTGRARSEPARGTGSSYTGDTGVDFVYGITPNLRAGFSANTDFAETEVDDRQVNLTRFPLRFPEKRQFFLEGNNFFNFSGFGDAFFSRRIGLNEGTPQRIDYGAKLTGQVGAQDIGLLQVRTGREGNRLGEDFTVLRGRRRILTESHLGGIYTRRAVREGNDPDLHTIGADLNLSTRRFLGDRNLTLVSHFLHTTNPAGTGDSLRFGSQVDLVSDLTSARLGFIETQKNFNPAVGFIDRTGTKFLDTNLRYAPRPANNRYIRQITFEGGIDRMTDSANRLLALEMEFFPLRVQFHSGDNFNFQVRHLFDRIEEDFRMGPRRSVVLPQGNEYWYNEYIFNFGMSNRRPLALGGRFRWGDYFSGTRRDLEPTLSIRPRNGLLAELKGGWTRIELPEGQFSVSILQANVSSQFNPWMSLASNLQYDNDTRNIGWQMRFRWILRPGNDIYLVYTHNWRDDPAGPAQTIDRQLASKIVFTHRF